MGHRLDVLHIDAGHFVDVFQDGFELPGQPLKVRIIQPQPGKPGHVAGVIGSDEFLVGQMGNC